MRSQRYIGRSKRTVRRNYPVDNEPEIHERKIDILQAKNLILNHNQTLRLLSGGNRFSMFDRDGRITAEVVCTYEEIHRLLETVCGIERK